MSADLNSMDPAGMPVTPDMAPRQPAWTDRGEGPVVVLLHSSMASKAQWKLLSERLVPAWRAIAIDLYGYGDAPEAPAQPGFGLADEAARVLSILDARLPAGTPWHLVGHSYGGGVALRVAHARPDRVRSVALYEPTAFHLVPAHWSADLAEVKAVARLAAIHPPAEREQATARFLDFWNGPGYFEGLPAARQAQFAALLPKVALDFQGLFGDSLTPQDHAALAVPVTLIGGRFSPICAHRVLQTLAGTWPQAALHGVEAGHMGPITHPHDVNALIEAHLAKAEPLPRHSN